MFDSIVGIFKSRRMDASDDICFTYYRAIRAQILYLRHNLGRRRRRGIDWRVVGGGRDEKRVCKCVIMSSQHRGALDVVIGYYFCAQ